MVSKPHSTMHFYPRPPRGGRRGSITGLNFNDEFLSTPSARRATPGQTPGMPRPLHFYPRPPRGGRRFGLLVTPSMCGFLSTPSARRATDGISFATINGEFLSTPSARRATYMATAENIVTVISIHALREEGDRPCQRLLYRQCNFYPRPPRGGRHRRACCQTCHRNFYPRPPRGGRPANKEG